MKKFLLYTCILVLMLTLQSCTVQFKAKEIELESRTNTSYRFTGFAWTEPSPSLHDPPR